LGRVKIKERNQVANLATGAKEKLEIGARGWGL